MSAANDEQSVENEIARLETQLIAARAKLNTPRRAGPLIPSAAQHALLLLSDSALPLGSFAFSSGLESYIAHHKSPAHKTPIQAFLSLALRTLATTSLPYLLAAYREPSRLLELDDTFDACNLCHVARRASISQGRALLTVWERALRGSVADEGNDAEEGKRLLAEMSLGLKKSSSSTASPNLQGAIYCATPSGVGHFAPLWAVVTRVLGIPMHESANVFLINHAKAVLSAAVRASVIGPYQAQALLASGWLREETEKLSRDNWDVALEDAGQGVPAMDLWLGRHEMLYSRIFNS